MQDHDKFVSGAEAKSFFEKSSLNPRQLHDIWYIFFCVYLFLFFILLSLFFFFFLFCRKLSDVDGDNRLSLNEFVVAMHLIMKVIFSLLYTSFIYYLISHFHSSGSFIERSRSRQIAGSVGLVHSLQTLYVNGYDVVYLSCLAAACCFSYFSCCPDYCSGIGSCPCTDLWQGVDGFAGR
jgi:hypothetical protein